MAYVQDGYLGTEETSQTEGKMFLWIMMTSENIDEVYETLETMFGGFDEWDIEQIGKVL